MTELQKYVLDADVFIEAKNRYYSFELAPSFWNNLILFAEQKRIWSIDRIKKQLEDGDDDLAQWIKDGNMRDVFASTDQIDVIESYKEIFAWVQANNQYYPAAKATYANDPDGWLIAFAKAKGYILVTHETLQVSARSRVLIPNVCMFFKIPCKNTFEMLLDLGVKF